MACRISTYTASLGKGHEAKLLAPRARNGSTNLLHNALSLRNQSLTLLTLPRSLYTVDRRESAVVLIRIWLCSASRVQQPNRPVAGILAARCPRSPMPALPDSGIQLKFGHLHRGTRITGSSAPSGRRILPKRPPKCVSQCRATSATHRNRTAYNVINNNSTHPNEMRHPHRVLRRSGEAGPRFLQVVKAP